MINDLKRSYWADVLAGGIAIVAVFYLAHIMVQTEGRFTTSVFEVLGQQPQQAQAHMDHGANLPHNVPYFGSEPGYAAIHSVGSGNWHSASTWENGTVPTANNTVHINPGHTVTIAAQNAAARAVSIDGKLAFSPNTNTSLRVVNLLVLPTGTLEIGTASSPIGASNTAEVVFPDVPLNTNFDPEQWGNGLIVFGTVKIHGRALNETFIRLAAEPKKGDKTISLANVPTGWRVGDRLLLPDSRQLMTSGMPSGGREEVMIQNISGTTVTLTSALLYDHPGARDVGKTENTLLNNGEKLLPHAVNLTRNVILRSENPDGTRAHSAWIHRANVDVRYAHFKGMGRTKNELALNSTTFDTNGMVTHIGTNQIGRYSIHAHHLIGPAATPSNGYQFTYQGLTIEDARKWGIAIHNAHYGLIKDNVIYKSDGGGIVTEDGNESYNVFDRNFVTTVRGTGSTGGMKANRGGDGFWFNSPVNYVRNNVATDTTFFGYSYFMQSLPKSLRIPVYKGADPSVNYKTINMLQQHMHEFVNNEAYFVRQGGLNIWDLGRAQTNMADLPESLVKDFKVWHHHYEGIFAYNANRLTADGLIVRADVSRMATNVAAKYRTARGTGFSNVREAKLNIIKNSDIQGSIYGISVPNDTGSKVGDHILQIENVYLRNYVNVKMHLPLGTNKGSIGRKVILKNVRHDSLPVTTTFDGSQWHYYMNANLGSSGLFVKPDEVQVFQHNGNSNDNFRLLYKEQDPSVIVPLTTKSTLGAPVAGLTNAQAWAQYGVAIGGSVATCSTVRDSINAFVCPSNAVYVPPVTAPTPAPTPTPGPVPTPTPTPVPTATPRAGQDPVSPTPTPTGALSASFASDRGTVPPGTKVTISWSTANATAVNISPNLGQVEASGSRTVTINSDTVYTLTASNSSETITRTIAFAVTRNDDPVDPVDPLAENNAPVTSPGGGAPISLPPDTVPYPLGEAGQNHAPIGHLDVAANGKVSGWAFDPNSTNTPVMVHIYARAEAGRGGEYITSRATGILRSDVNEKFNVTGNHGFAFDVPVTASVNGQYNLYAYAVDSQDQTVATLLIGSPKLFAFSNSAGAPLPQTPASTPSSSAQIVDGRLIKHPNSPAIYVIENGAKRAFASMEALVGMGYNLGLVNVVDTDSLPVGEPIFTNNQRHVRGTLVNDNGTIYFLGAQLRYAFPSEAIFNSWGRSFAEVVMANDFDRQMPTGPLVEMKQ